MEKVRSVLSSGQSVVFFGFLLFLGLGWLLPIKALLWSSFYSEDSYHGQART